MSLLRALRAYVGLGPDDHIEDRYLFELNARRRQLDLDELDELDEHDEHGVDTADYIEAPTAAVPDGERPILEAATEPAMVAEPDVGTAFDDLDGMRSDDRHDAHRSGADRRTAGDRPLVDAALDSLGLGDLRLGGRSVVQPRASAADERPRDRRHQRADDRVDDDVVIVGAPASAGERAVGAASGRPRHGGVESGAGSGSATDGGVAVVHSLDSMRAKPRTIAPASFGDAKLVADEFKRDIPVLLNLQAVERDLARRLIDFASGICYALDGSMEKLATQVFLLTPDGVEVSEDDRRRIEERGYAR